MTTTATSQFALTDDELLAVSSRVGVQSLPVVLALRPRHATETELLEAFDRATAALCDHGLLRDGEVIPELSSLVRSLQRPARELAMRLVTPDGTARVAVVRHGGQAVSAVRIGNDITIEGIEGEASLGSAVRALLRRLPSATAAEIAPVGAPLDTVGQALSDTNDSAALSDRIRALGTDARAAIVLGSALASRLAFAEIVYYSLDCDADLISRCPAAVVVFYTKRGRIVSAPSASPSGQLWATLKPGSDHAIKQAIGQLVELSVNRWEES